MKVCKDQAAVHYRQTSGSLLGMKVNIWPLCILAWDSSSSMTVVKTKLSRILAWETLPCTKVKIKTIAYCIYASASLPSMEVNIEPSCIFLWEPLPSGLICSFA